MKRLKNTLIYLGVRTLLGLVRLVGLRLGRPLGRGLGRWAFRLGRVERRRTLAHLDLAFPELPPAERLRLGRACFAHLGESLVELVHVDRLGPLTEVMAFAPGARELLDAALARGRGVVYVTGHVGNWELMARAMHVHGYGVNTIGQRAYDPRLTRLLERFRLAGGVRTLWRGDPDLVAGMRAALDRNELMGLLIDQDTDVPGCFTPFFGRLAHTPTAAAFLARRAGAPMLAGFNHRRPEGGYLITLEEIEPSGQPEPSAAVEQDTHALNACIERHIRAHPAEWVWMHRRWKTRPPGEGEA